MIMAKRARRRAIVLESDDDEDDEDGARPASKLQALHLTSSSAQSSEMSNTGPERKLQKLSQQPTVNSLFEARRKIPSKKVSRRTLPLELIAVPVANTHDSSKRRKGKASANFGSAPPNLQQAIVGQHVDHRLWVDKYTPKSVGELVVHSKKVAEVKEWLEGQLLNPYGSHLGSRVLILTGPAGVGKTAVVHVLADLLGIELSEWTTPAPELWQEYSHHAASGGPYVSKLDEFEEFLERGRKMPSLPVVSVALSTSQIVRPFSGDDRAMPAKKSAKVLVIDDLPILNSRDQHQRLARSLYRLALSRSFPTIVVVTDETGTGDSLGEREYPHKGAIEALEQGGAKKIVFNPVTVNAMKKLLSKIQVMEKCRLSSESISAIAENSAGDIRQALTSLQFLSLGCSSRNLHHSIWDPGGLDSSLSDPSLGGARDSSLSLYHALGKFLHNKRHTDEVHSAKGTVFKLKEEFRRYPLNMEEPEVIIAQAHTETGTILAFLHENVLQFIDENATDDVAAISAYLSDTDYLLGAQGSFRTRHTLINSNDVDPSQVGTATASSVAARGVLFGNNHPAPKRWQSLRAPALWQVERQKKLKKEEIFAQALDGKFPTVARSGLVQAMELHSFSHRLSTIVHTGNQGVEAEDPMQFDECEQQGCTDFPPRKGMMQDGSAIESTFMQMCVDDDIEDPD